MNEPITERTTQGIAAKINRIKQQSCKNHGYQCQGGRQSPEGGQGHAPSWRM